MTLGLFVLACCTLAFAMLAKRLSASVLTAPMFFMALGYGFSETSIFPTDHAEAALHLVAEIALIVLLFLDAAQTDLQALRSRHVWPVRMLLIGLPLAILLGALGVAWFLPSWPVAAVLLVAAILAPTDAALGQAVVTNPLVPERVRRALTVESGLNDGLALPIVLLFASLTADAVGGDERNWILFGAKQLILGPAAGIFVGWFGGKIFLAASSRGLTSEPFEGIGALGLAVAAYLGADTIGGNGFIAAFAAGLCFGNVVKGRCKFVYEFTESEGQLLTWSAFFLLGLALVPEAIHYLSAPILGVIFLSLFIVRPLAIYLSLSNTGASPATKLFFGWFGPRGLATALFALLVFKDIGYGLAEPVLALAINAVWISTVLHGLSAVPAAGWYARLVEKSGECAETEPIDGSAKPLVTHHTNSTR